MSTHIIRSTARLQTDPEPVISWQAALLLVLSATLGASLALWLMPHWLPVLLNDMSQQQTAWHLARSSGIAAYVMLWLSTALGLSISNRLARLWPGGPTAFDLHQFTSLLALAGAVFHALILLGDATIGYTLLQVLTPFAAQSYRPISTGWGQLALYLGALVSFSFYVRARIGRKVWRLLHFGSFAVYGLVTMHGVLAGSDTSLLWPLYFSSLTSILCLTLYRIFVNIKS